MKPISLHKPPPMALGTFEQEEWDRWLKSRGGVVVKVKAIGRHPGKCKHCGKSFKYQRKRRECSNCRRRSKNVTHHLSKPILNLSKTPS